MKTLLLLFEKLLGAASPEGEPRADMYLPEKMLASAIVGVIMAAFFTWRCSATGELVWAVFTVIMALVAVGAVLCWRNQTIRILDDDRFEYTTFLGNRREYKFSDITALRRNKDSITVFVAGDKVHIESMAVLSPRLVEKINAALADQ